MIIVVMKIALVILLILLLAPLIFAPFYLKFGFGKRLFHDVFGWHIPTETEESTFDGLNTHNHCKHCGKEIMQDSQGNWF